MPVIRLGATIRFSLMITPLVMLAGCAAVPDLGPKPAVRSAASVASTESLLSTSSSSWPVDGWWRGYGDAQLDQLIDEGLRDSPNVTIAMARFRRAQAMAQQSGSALLPSVDAQGTVQKTRQSLNMGYPDEFKDFLPKGWRTRGEGDLALNFDLDIWGKNRAALAAATSERQAAAIDVAQAQLMITTGIADAYADLAHLYAIRDIQQSALTIKTSTRKLVNDRLASGLGTRGDLRQSDAGLSTAKTNLAAAEEAIALRRNQLAALVGAGPDRGLKIERPALPLVGDRGLPSGVTTELVSRRPDVAASLLRVEAAASRIKVARADFFPAINLSGLIGMQSLGLDLLTKKDSLYGSAGPAISLPIFHGGALAGQYRGARATYDEAVATYDQAVISAYREVADAVTSRQSLGSRLNDARAALVASEDSYRIARLRYEGGLSPYLDVLTVEERLLQARQAMADLDTRAISLDIALIRALGGGFAARNDKSKDDNNG